MKRPVTVEYEGATLRMTRTKFDRLFKPRGARLVADENGDPVRSTKKKTAVAVEATED